MFLNLWKKTAAAWSPLEFVRPGGYNEIWRVTWPLIILNASNVVMMLCNRGFLAYNQTEDLTAAVTAGQLFFCINSFFLITTSFTGTIVAQHFGNRDRESCVKAVWNGFYFGIAVTAAVLCLMPVLGSFLFQQGNLSETIREKELAYFLALTPSAGFSCMEAPFLSYFTATGRTKIVAAVKIGTCLISVPLNYVMIFGKLGCPALGIAGAGAAASTAGCFSLAAAVLAFVLQNQAEWPSRRNRKFEPSIIRKLLVFGAPGGLQACVRSAAFASVLMFFGFLGDMSLASATLAMTINNIAFIPLLGLMDAASVITGKYIGERKIRVAEKISGRAMLMLSVYMTVMGVLYLAAPDLLINLFKPEMKTGIDFSSVRNMVRIILMCQIVQNYFDGLRFIVSGSLRGAGDTKVPLLLSILTAWLVQVPMAFLLTCVYRAPVWLAWAGAISFYVAVDAVVIQIRKNTGVWKRIKVVALPSAEDGDETQAA